MLKKVMMVLIIMGLMMFLVSSAAAASSWYICQINNTGLDLNTNLYRNGHYIVKLSHTGGQFTEMSFYLERNEANKEIFAVFLTAASAGYTVQVLLDPADDRSITGAQIWLY